MAQAENETHIRRRYLEALEAEDLANLPASVYTRGFVRSYAEYLGLNPSAVAEMYAAATAPVRKDPPPLRPAVPHVHIPRELPVRAVAIAIGVVIGLAVIVYGWMALQEAAAAMREEQGVASVGGTPNATVRQPTPHPIAVNSPVPSPTATAAPTAPPTSEPTPVVDGILVQFRTTARVYVEAAVDGQPVLAETLPAGTDRTLPLGESLVVMRVSNASAVELTYNGRRQDPTPDAVPMEFTWRR